MNIHQTPPLPLDPKDAEHLRLLSIFHYVMAGITALVACIPFIHVAIGVMVIMNPEAMNDSGNQAPPPAAFGWLFVGMGSFFIIVGWAAAICTLVSARYLARRQRRMFSFVVAAILCLFMPFGTVLGIFTILVLSRDSVQRLYGNGVAA
jgi:hypothetical protein